VVRLVARAPVYAARFCSSSTTSASTTSFSWLGFRRPVCPGRLPLLRAVLSARRPYRVQRTRPARLRFRRSLADLMVAGSFPLRASLTAENRVPDFPFVGPQKFYPRCRVTFSRTDRRHCPASFRASISSRFPLVPRQQCNSASRCIFSISSLDKPLLAVIVNLLFFAGAQVLGVNIQNAIGVDIERGLQFEARRRGAGRDVS